MKVLATLSLALLALPAQAAVYKYVDADGNVTFTDRYRPGAIKFLDTEPGHTPAATPGKRSGTPANFPRVDRKTQSRRDDVRRALLLEERGNEEKALADVRAQLTDARPRNPGDLGRLEESRRLHEKNIEMLDKELARIK